jgi:hypothetical protein
MGCGCKKVVQAAGSDRTYVVDARGVREVTGMVLPALTASKPSRLALTGQAGKASAQTVTAQAQEQYVVPGLLLGGAAGIALAKTVLVAHPFVAAAVGIGAGLWYGLSNMLSCQAVDPSSPLTAAQQTANCQSQGAVVGVALGAGAGLLLEGFVQRYNAGAGSRSAGRI